MIPHHILVSHKTSFFFSLCRFFFFFFNFQYLYINKFTLKTEKTFILIKKKKRKTYYYIVLYSLLVYIIIIERIELKLTGLPDFRKVSIYYYTIAYYAVSSIYIIYNTRVFANACIFHTVFRSSIILAINRNLEPLSNHWRPPRNQEIYHTYINTHANIHTE